MKLAIYGHGGSQNHGNEAIVRGVSELFPDEEITVYTFSPAADRHFELEEVCNLRRMERYTISKRRRTKTSWIFDVVRTLKKVFGKSSLVAMWYYYLLFEPFIKDIDPETVYMLEAGDQYCEPGEHRFFYAMLNKRIKQKGGKTVMLGCTINPDLLEDTKVKEDLARYDLIVARESITYNALLKSNINTKIVFAPCPAFAMPAEKADLPKWMQKGKFIGINVGFLAQGNEQYYQSLMKNCSVAIQRILQETDLNVALIPHVNWSYGMSDFGALDELYKTFKLTGRVFYLHENSASQQKFLISHCKAFVALRTHAAISALACQVPTLIAGYKTKSRGIGQDIFGKAFDMVADVQSLDSDTVIADKLFAILKNEQEIREYYAKRMPEYLSDLEKIKHLILEIHTT